MEMSCRPAFRLSTRDYGSAGRPGEPRVVFRIWVVGRICSCRIALCAKFLHLEEGIDVTRHRIVEPEPVPLLDKLVSFSRRRPDVPTGTGSILTGLNRCCSTRSLGSDRSSLTPISPEIVIFPISNNGLFGRIEDSDTVRDPAFRAS